MTAFIVKTTPHQFPLRSQSYQCHNLLDAEDLVDWIKTHPSCVIDNVYTLSELTQFYANTSNTFC